MKAWIRRGAAALMLAVLISPSLLAEEPRTAGQSKETFYFQVVYGADSNVAPAENAIPIGPKLRKRLERVFRWKHYWEVKRGQFVVERAKTAKVDISERRRLEVSFVESAGLEIRIFKNGELVRKTREKQPLDFTLIGGDDGKRQSWFIIVRRDKPSSTE